MHNPGNVAFALAVTSLRSALVGPLLCPRHFLTRRETDFERLVGQDLWRLESVIKQVREFASHRKSRDCPLRRVPSTCVPGSLRFCISVGEWHLCGSCLLFSGGSLAAPDVSGRKVARLTEDRGSVWRRWRSPVSWNLAHTWL